MNSANRIVFGSGQRGCHHLVPEILEAGWGRFTFAESGHLRPHAHTNAFELCYIVSGEVEWRTGTSADVLREGDLYVTQPNELHWGRDCAMHPCSLYWLIVDRGCAQSPCDPLFRTLERFHGHRLRGSRRMADLFVDIFEEHSARLHRADRLTLRQSAVRASLIRLLVEVVRACQAQMKKRPSSLALGHGPTQALNAIRLFDQSDYEPDIIERACRLTGISRRQLDRQFLEEFGTTLSQYWLRRRIRLARERLLKSDSSVTRVAADLGFSSSQHFATVFHRITGITPSAYRSGAET